MSYFGTKNIMLIGLKGGAGDADISNIDAVYSGDADAFIPEEGLVWEQGSLWEGGNTSSTTRIRTNKFTVNKGDTILLRDSAKGRLKYSVHLINKTSGAFIKETGWRGNGLPYVFDDDYAARIVCSYVREATIGEAEGANFTFKALGQRNVDIDILQSRIERKPLPSMFAAAHRGYTEGLDVAHNTIEDFENAIKYGYKFLETDVHVTNDGYFVLCHDATIAGLTIAISTLAELQAVTEIATLDEFLMLCKKYDVVPVIEMKGGFGAYETVQRFIEKIEKYNLEGRAFITAFDYVDLLVANGINPNLNFVWWRSAGQKPSEWQFVNEIGMCKTPNNRVYIGYEVSTELDYAEALNLIKKCGLDGIIAHVVDNESRLDEITPYIAGYITNDILPFSAGNIQAYDVSVTFE